MTTTNNTNLSRNRKDQNHISPLSFDSIKRKNHQHDGLLPEPQQLFSHESREDSTIGIESSLKEKRDSFSDSGASRDIGLNDERHKNTRQQKAGHRLFEENASVAKSPIKECTVVDYCPINTYLGSLHMQRMQRMQRRRQREREARNNNGKSPSEDKNYSGRKDAGKQSLNLYSNSNIL